LGDSEKAGKKAKPKSEATLEEGGGGKSRKTIWGGLKCELRGGSLTGRPCQAGEKEIEQSGTREKKKKKCSRGHRTARTNWPRKIGTFRAKSN